MNEASDFVLFLGRFHPLVVHLPIGFLFFAFVLEIYSKIKKDTTFTKGIPLALFSGAMSAVIACVLGYMLSLSGDYSENALDIHFWFGIATTIVAFVAWLIRIDKIKFNSSKAIKTNISSLALIVILLSVTGHYGGNLTHGSDYLTKYAPFGQKEKQVVAKVTKIEDAVLYTNLVDPILENKCTSCHNSDKRKGGLMLHDSISIVNGGKNGPVLVAGDASKSELVRRVLLDPNHDDFMPPEGKTPLTAEEIAILTFWINQTDANFSAKMGTLESPENILKTASGILGLDESSKKTLAKLDVVDAAILNDLKSEGFQIRELVFESNLFDVVLPSKTIKEANKTEIDKKLQKLAQIKEHILWLSLEDNFINDAHLKTIGNFSNLQKLVLSNNPITDTGITALVKLTKLNSINLYNSNITNVSLKTLSEIKNLEKIYAWRTKIKKEDLEQYTSETSPEIVL